MKVKDIVLDTVKAKVVDTVMASATENANASVKAKVSASKKDVDANADAVGLNLHKKNVDADNLRSKLMNNDEIVEG